MGSRHLMVTASDCLSAQRHTDGYMVNKLYCDDHDVDDDDDGDGDGREHHMPHQTNPLNSIVRATL